MNSKSSNKISEYFAAQNSYYGFISHFDDLLERDDIKRIFLIKGGPGTGKSSMMKSIAAHFLNLDHSIEKIYCSSDPSSLDGVIISAKEGSVALIDATAPHERDTHAPGAVDEIINLGEGWDDRFLISQKEDVNQLYLEKKKAYKTAYSYLAIAGKCEEHTKSIYELNLNRKEVKYWAEGILKDLSPTKSGKSNERLISSFSRNGYVKNTDFLPRAEQNVLISDSRPAAYMLIDLVKSIAEHRELSFIRYIYPLDPNLTEALFLPASGLLISVTDKDGLDPEKFIGLPKEDMERTRKALEIKEECLHEAERWLAISSDIHFRLENIYSQAMDFSKNQAVLNNLILKIGNILEN